MGVGSPARFTMESPQQPSTEGLPMKNELISPTAALAAALLQKSSADVNDPNVIGSAFETAYLGLLNGIQRVSKQDPPPKMKRMPLSGV